MNETWAVEKYAPTYPSYVAKDIGVEPKIVVCDIKMSLE